MTDEKDPDREDSGASEDSALGSVDDTETRDDSDDELDALEGEGFDRVVAEARAKAAGGGPAPGVDPGADPEVGAQDAELSGNRPYTAEEVGLRKVGGRSPIVAVAVIIVGVFLLAVTWGDFRYFLRVFQSEARDLGTVDDIYVDGEFTENFDNEWVVIEGDPDVQHAARMQSREGWIGFMRLIEANTSLFVAVPRATEKVTNEFPGRFEGRIRRLDKVSQWDKLRTFFDAEEIVDVVDLDPSAVVAAAGNPHQRRGAGGAAEVALADGGGTELLEPSDTLRMVVAQPAAVAQLGRSTWRTREQAEAVVAQLGRPYAFVEKRNTVWVFAVWVGADAGRETYQQLTLALNGGVDVLSADPKEGALVLPRRATYLVEFGDLQTSGDGLSFTYGANTAETGWKIDASEQALTRIPLEGDRLTVPVNAIEAMRVERLLTANPDGYLIMVDQRPRDVWPSAAMFFAVFGVVVLNGWTLLVTLRRRRTAAEA